MTAQERIKGSTLCGGHCLKRRKQSLGSVPRFYQDGLSCVWRARVREEAGVLLLFVKMYLIMGVQCIQGPFNISPTKSMALRWVITGIPLVHLGCTWIPHTSSLFYGYYSNRVFLCWHVWKLLYRGLGSWHCKSWQISKVIEIFFPGRPQQDTRLSPAGTSGWLCRVLCVLSPSTHQPKSSTIGALLWDIFMLPLPCLRIFLAPS